MADAYDVFISYARENRRQAEALRELLAGRGWRVFLDVRRLRPGQPWRAAILEAVRGAPAVCVLWSEAAHRPERSFVREEASEAKALDSYFPICLDDSGVPFGFTEYHYADLVDWDGGAEDTRLPEVLDQLEDLLAERGARRGFLFEGTGGAQAGGSAAVQLQVAAGAVMVDPPPVQLIDTRRHPLREGIPPDWASAWGEDEYGVWTEFTLEQVTQRLRWIPPGRFVMGSPTDEPGRDEDEGPAHEVILTQGYWLLDTPCTQALWEAVIGENPSDFKSPTRPVERVSWEDCQGFLERINRRLPGLALSLPSEAQWEHACRAGTEAATYAGALEILGDANAPVLDPIAWYGGNSRVEFELKNGMDASQWLKDRQYPEPRSGTHPVGRKRPNPWGLYDMLGNVREWCLDGGGKYAAEPATDPIGPIETGAGRVLRGGSWDNGARDVRCAYRSQDHPGYRNVSIGFRPARVQS